MTKLLSIDEAAETLAISRATLQRLVDCGRLPAMLITSGKRKRLQRIDEADLEKFLEGLKSGQKQQPRGDSRKLRHFEQAES